MEMLIEIFPPHVNLFILVEEYINAFGLEFVGNCPYVVTFFTGE